MTNLLAANLLLWRFLLVVAGLARRLALVAVLVLWLLRRGLPSLALLLRRRSLPLALWLRALLARLLGFLPLLCPLLLSRLALSLLLLALLLGRLALRLALLVPLLLSRLALSLLLFALLLGGLSLGLALLIFLLPGFLLGSGRLLGLRRRLLHPGARCLGNLPALFPGLLAPGGLRPRLPLGGGWSPVRPMGCDGGRRCGSRQHRAPRDRTAGGRRHLRFIDLWAEDRDPVLGHPGALVPLVGIQIGDLVAGHGAAHHPLEAVDLYPLIEHPVVDDVVARDVAAGAVDSLAVGPRYKVGVEPRSQELALRHEDVGVGSEGDVQLDAGPEID